MSPLVYHLPDTLRTWPWHYMISEHYRQAQAASVAWLESFWPFTPDVQRAFNKIDCNNLRTFCDCAHIFFAIDDYTEVMNVADVKSLCAAAIEAVENPDKPRPEEESIIGEMSRQMWQRACINAPKACRERFVKAWRAYLAAVVQQAEHRSSSYICDPEGYMAVRREDIGSFPCFALLEISLDLDLPHEVMDHPAIDMYSYKKEILIGNTAFNAVTVIMRANLTDVAGGMQWISDRHDEVAQHFLATRDDILNHKNGVPLWGRDMDEQVEKYVDGLGQWVRDDDQWYFGSERYFGDTGMEIEQCRIVRIP
ncbi:terpenoid synthase [Mycena rebaudengoi]|nr:terpenoid synthase [Mycena rebaudengoi]